MKGEPTYHTDRWNTFGVLLALNSEFGVRNVDSIAWKPTIS